MRTLVTGAAGFIGSHVVRALVARGHDVRALVLARDDLRNLRELDVEVRLGDVTDAASVARAMRGVEVVFHLAAVYALWMPDPTVMHRVNVEGTRVVFDEALRAGVRRVVHTSSIARFGGQGLGRRATEESPFALGVTGDVYSRTKADAHALAERESARQDVVIVAPCGPIGPGDVGPTPTGRLLLACAQSPVVALPRTVSNVADVRDMAEGHVLAAERGVRGRSYLLGHRDVSVIELAEMAQRIIGVSRRVWEIPSSWVLAAGHAAGMWADHVSHRAPVVTAPAARIGTLGLAADCARAVRELGMPQSPIEDALRDALAWFAAEGYVTDARVRARALSAT